MRIEPFTCHVPTLLLRDACLECWNKKECTFWKNPYLDRRWRLAKKRMIEKSDLKKNEKIYPFVEQRHKETIVSTKRKIKKFI